MTGLQTRPAPTPTALPIGLPRQSHEWLVAVVALAAGLIAAFGVLAAGLSPSDVTMVLTLAVTAGLGFVAMYRFEWFVLAVLLIRPALDDLKSDSLDPLQPAAVLGLLVIAAGIARLIADRVQGIRVLATPMGVAWVVCGVLFTLSLPTSLNKAESLPANLGFISSVVMYLMIERTLRLDRTALKRVLFVVGAGVFIPVTTAIIQYFWTASVDPISGLARLTGSFSHFNPFATYLVLILLLLLGPLASTSARNRLLLLGPILATFFVLLNTFARAAWISFATGALVFTWRRDRRLAMLLLVGLVVAAALIPGVGERIANVTATEGADGGAKTDDSLAWRIGYWGEVAPLFFRNPFSGVGLQVVPTLTLREARPHNSFLQAAVEGGVLGLFGWVFLVGTALVLVIKAWRVVDSPRFTTFQSTVLLGSIVASTSVVIQLFTENIMTDTILQWYLNVGLATMAVWVWADRVREAPPQRVAQAPKVTLAPWLAGVVAISAVAAAFLGFTSSSNYRAEAYLSVNTISANPQNRGSLDNTTEDLVVVARLPLVRDAAKARANVPGNTNIQPDAGQYDEARSTVWFAAVHPDPDKAEELAEALATEAAIFYSEGRSISASSPVSVSRSNVTEQAIAEGAIWQGSTTLVSAWPKYVQSAVIGALVSMLAGAALTMFFEERARRRLARQPAVNVSAFSSLPQPVS